jgi:O-methyltransferase involved in polyketide biosynthesis
MMAGEKVHLTKEKEALLITVHGKALESRLPQSLPKDRFADETVGSHLTRLGGRQGTRKG